MSRTYTLALWPGRRIRKITCARHADAEAAARRWLHRTQGAQSVCLRPDDPRCTDWQRVHPDPEPPRLSWPVDAYTP